MREPVAPRIEVRPQSTDNLLSVSLCIREPTAVRDGGGDGGANSDGDGGGNSDGDGVGKGSGDD